VLESRKEYGYEASLGDDVSRPETDSFGWNMFLFAVAVAMVAVNWGFLRPASRQIEQLQSTVRTLEQQVALLVKTHGSAERAVNLLGLLTEQGRRADAAEASLRKIHQLQDHLLLETTRLGEAHQGLRQMAEVRQEIARQVAMMHEARGAIAEMREIQQQMLAAAATSSEAEAAVSRFAGLKQQLAVSVDTLTQSENLVLGDDRLHRQLMSTASANEQAELVADRLSQLQDTLVSSGTKTDEAYLTLCDLIDIRDQLDNQAVGMPGAQDTLRQMVGLKDKVLEQSDDVGTAVETLELTVDLTEDFQQASQSFEEMRRWLNDVILMEPTVRRAMETLEPITALGNLRRISAEELRQAARVVSDMRRAQGGRESGSESGEAAEVASSPEADRK